MPKKKKSKKNIATQPVSSDKDWQARDDLSTIKRAEEIKMDSKKMSAVKKMAEKEIKAMSHVVALKAYIKKSKDRGILN